MLLLILSLFVLTACKEDNAETDESLLPNNDDYQDIEVTKITYEMFYFQNFSKIKYIIDFETNEVKVVMIPYEENNETIFETIAIFTDEQEKEFINTCYKNGLFTLEEFDNEEIIPIHMHGWGLVIEFLMEQVNLHLVVELDQLKYLANVSKLILNYVVKITYLIQVNNNFHLI